MARTTPVERLTRSGPAELEIAWRHRDQLLAAARRLVAAAAHDPDVAHCREASCGLAEGSDDRLCGAAHRLAGLTERAPVPQSERGPIPPSLDDARHGFLTALTGALDAVRACRQTAHPSGSCWFTSVPGGDGCAEILHLAHRGA